MMDRTAALRRTMGKHDRRFRLRAATASQHATLDALVSKAGYFASIDRYRHWLQASHGFQMEAEKQLAEASIEQLLRPQPVRHRVALLALDLTDLGCRPAPPMQDTLRPPRDGAEALGMLYVMEGAALGARILLRQAESLGLTSTYGARHLAFAASDLGSWQNVLALLEAFECPVDDEARMFAAAGHTFAAAQSHMSLWP